MENCYKAAAATAAAWAEITGPLSSAREKISLEYDNLKKKRADLAKENGCKNRAAYDDLLEINAGGQIVLVRRGILTQYDGTLLEALFGGRWDGRLQRDQEGRIFLDVNPNCFRVIVDFLRERKESLPDDPLDLPQVIKEDEQFLRFLMSTFGLDGVINSTSGAEPEQKKRENSNPEEWETLSFNEFPEKLRDALTNEQRALIAAKEELKNEETSLEKEEALVKFFTGGDAKEVVWLNVRDKLIASKRTTLGLCEDSALAKQFNDPKWAREQESHSEQAVKKWNPEEVAGWAGAIEGMPESVSRCLSENNVNGIELLAMKREDFWELGINRTGTLALLIEAIGQLKRSIDRNMTYVDCSPYCFEKIVDHLRLRAMCQSQQKKPPLPFVRESQQKQFMTVVDYYFPGDCASFISGMFAEESAVLCTTEASQIHNWLQEERVFCRAELLYRASRDGWRAAQFHLCCDNQGATITVIQTTGGYVFGGFADTPWASSGGNKASPNAFLFALRIPSGLGPLKMSQTGVHSDWAVYHNSDYGPTFGGGHDIHIIDNASSNRSTTLMSSYECPPGQRNETFLNGSKLFWAAEIEVFRIT